MLGHATLSRGLVEDAQAMLTGTLLAAVGVVLFQRAGLLAGGTVGLALLLTYATNIDLSIAILLANAPFYVLAGFRMGLEFTVKTLACAGLVALFVRLIPLGLAFDHLSPVLASVLGGLLAGMGMLVLFRHRASLGGFNVLVLYLHERFGWSTGKTQMLFDAVVLVGGSLFIADMQRAALSFLAMAALNLVLVFNHRPERYLSAE
ncbi:YitT family protein [Ramlibacter sp. WS9]|uniref:YitT family protein n=1 Tax=Ramlibacter sp. WS9 TaxID=1882741 RepID=UPI001142D88A|nr:YitT family protein [Ramlibacter sp. WS9]ROZ78147.1 YitT family protein [Ramlibacter sp. WS9]